MRILTKNKDYYDGVAGTMGIDKTIIYDRNVIKFDDKAEFPKQFKAGKFRNKNNFLNLDMYGIDSEKYLDCSSFVIGFCGRLYVGWKFFYKGKHEDHYDISYDVDFIKKHIKHKTWSSNLDDDLNYILNYDSIDLFREFNTPIFIFDNSSNRIYMNIKNEVNWGKPKFIINGNLKSYCFYKVFDSFTAFQEIQMFISGVLGVGENSIIEIEDKYKIKKHGFDKWSFRKEPTKKIKR